MDNNQLDLLAKLIRDGADEEEISQFIKKGNTNLDTAINARDAFEKSLARQYLKQTGISIPNYKNASTDQLEKFSRDLLAEQNPALKRTNVEILDNMKNYGSFNSKSNTAKVSKNLNKDIEDFVSALMHEGGHSYDSESGLYVKNPSIKLDSFGKIKTDLMKSQGIKKGADLAKQEASIIGEILQTGHHAKIPNVREGSFGLANLKNIMKGKAVRVVPFIGPAIGAATALATGDASAAVPVVNEMDALGPREGSLEQKLEKGTITPEQSDELYKSFEQRRKAIEQLSQRRMEDGK